MGGRGNTQEMAAPTRSSFWAKWKGGSTWLGEGREDRRLWGTCAGPWGRISPAFPQAQGVTKARVLAGDGGPGSLGSLPILLS